MIKRSTQKSTLFERRLGLYDYAKKDVFPSSDGSSCQSSRNARTPSFTTIFLLQAQASMIQFISRLGSKVSTHTILPVRITQKALRWALLVGLLVFDNVAYLLKVEEEISAINEPPSKPLKRSSSHMLVHTNTNNYPQEEEHKQQQQQRPAMDPAFPAIHAEATALSSPNSPIPTATHAYDTTSLASSTANSLDATADGASQASSLSSNERRSIKSECDKPARRPSRIPTSTRRVRSLSNNLSVTVMQPTISDSTAGATSTEGRSHSPEVHTIRRIHAQRDLSVKAHFHGNKEASNLITPCHRKSTASSGHPTHSLYGSCAHSLYSVTSSSVCSSESIVKENAGQPRTGARTSKLSVK
ncbi:uncharacterized protein BYT42DRAFT_640847 [Radiomyces spectabilis]|uniref:uncharacterized protein n=1 Tax=Radiomyces spectabilis TaxID=64574 RepID=UPI00221F57A2|nr:uncharacterized protein BYT42DRAFT_640847 [Radiomyces spectabilis]KAI8393713.1 hypothetical protein BYT42DRAFT_640847 [Radiomyces spectabilis]